MDDNKKPALRFKGFTDDWEQRKLGDMVDVRSGRDYKHLSDGDIPVYGTGGYMLSVNEALSYNEDAIGIGRKGTIDKPYVLKAPFWTVDTLFYAVPRNEYVLSFVFDIFENIDWKKKDESTGVPSLSKSAINEIGVLAPQYDEQKIIGRYFADLDHLITLHQRKYDKLINVKKSMLEKMFPENGCNIPEIRFKGFTNIWEQRKVGELCSISTGKSNTQDKIEDGEYPFYVRSPIIERSTKYLFDEEAVITVGDGVGTGKVFHYVNGKYDLHQRCYRMYGFSEQLNAKYFYHAFSLLFYKRVMAMTAKTSVDSVRYEMIAEMEIPVPNVIEQKKISDTLDSIDHLITLHQQELDKLKNIKKSMLDKMFV